MVDQIGKSGSLAREAILAAMNSQAKRSADVRHASGMIGQVAGGGPGGSQAAGGASDTSTQFVDTLKDGLREVEGKIQEVEDLPKALLDGRVEDLHEVAAMIKKAEFSFRFSMEMRNKLIDAYREVMRMSV